MSAVLEFPNLDAASAAVMEQTAPQRAALAVLSIKDATLARFTATEADLRALAEKYRAVAFDVQTPKGLADAKKARNELREFGRYVVQRVEKSVKDEVNDLKRVVSAEAERLIAIVKPAEDAIDAQIVAREYQIAEERAERERQEAQRRAVHEAGIAQIRAYVKMAAGQPSERIAAGIAVLQRMEFAEADWQEYAEPAAIARDATIEALNQLHEQAIVRESEALRLEQLEAENAALRTQRAALDASIAQDRMRAAFNRAWARVGSMQTLATRDAYISLDPAGESVPIEQCDAYIAALDALQPNTPQGDQPCSEHGREVMEPEACESATGRGTTGAPALATLPHYGSPVGGPMGAGQPAAAGPTLGDRIDRAVYDIVRGAPESNPDVVAAMVPTLKLGTVAERLGFNLTRAFVETTLGIAPAATEKSWALWRESDWPRIKNALIAHIKGAC